MTRCRVHDQPGLLGDHHDVIVAMDHIDDHAGIGGRRLPRREQRDVDGHRLALAQTQLPGSLDPTVDARSTRLDE